MDFFLILSGWVFGLISCIIAIIQIIKKEKYKKMLNANINQFIKAGNKSTITQIGENYHAK